MQDDPYAILGVQKNASAEDIKKAYRKLARTSHPDINPDDPEAKTRFVKISAAYDLLKDPETRRRFDAGEIDASGQEKAERRYYRDHAGGPGDLLPARGRRDRQARDAPHQPALLGLPLRAQFLVGLLVV